MTKWILSPELQEKYQKVLAETERLQIELGIKSSIPESRSDAESIKQKPIVKLRPKPNWKV